MKYQILGLVAVLVGCASAPGADATSAPPTCAGEQAEDPAVVRVFAGDMRCTGVLVSKSEIMTAAHCVHDDVRIEIGGVRYLATARWVGGPHGEDVALVELSSPLESAQPAAFATVAPRGGDALTLIGYGCTDKQLARPVMRRWDGDGDGCTCHGDSGAPLFNSDGELVSINWAAGTPALVDVSR